MYSTPYRPYVGAHKNIWEPIILVFQMYGFAYICPFIEKVSGLRSTVLLVLVVLLTCELSLQCMIFLAVSNNSFGMLSK
jgi:hypothetical protein